MLLSEFLEKTSLDEKIACGMLDREQITQIYFDTINPCYMVSNFDSNSKFCKYYKKHGFINCVNKCKKDFYSNIKVINLEKNYMGNYSIKLYNPCLNTDYSHVYCGYNKTQVMQISKLEFYRACLNMYR